jgi:hypothetical protein
MNSRFASLLAALLVTSLLAGLVRAQPAAPALELPPIPQAKSPVELFRKLIVATPAEADELLRDRTPEQRRVIEEKLVEYRLLPPPLREWRLKATELRWYLPPLMRLPPGNRTNLLQTVPPEDRPLVEARLQQWDLLPPGEQQALLNNELAVRYLSRPGGVPTLPPATLSTLPLAERTRLEQAVAQWQEMPESRREELSARFSRFFNLDAQEQNRTLDLLTVAEREQLRLTIDSFASLPPAERERCLQAVRRFSQMTREERFAFLEGAERWRSLSEAQRENWRGLVTKLPPAPPGALLPPLPPGMKPAAPGAGLRVPDSGQALATNSL